MRRRSICRRRIKSTVVIVIVIVENIKSSTIKPIPKCKYKLSDSNNYRSIAIGSVLGKIIDRILLCRFSDLLNII